MDISEYMQAAMAHAQSGRMADAVRTLEAAAKEHDGSAQAHAMLGTLLHQSGRNADAVTHLRRAHEIAPTVGPIAFQLGAILVAMERPLDGLPYMQKALDADATWMPGLLGFARALQGVGDFDRCEPVYRRALGVDPRNAEAMTGLAGMMMVSGRQREAMELFRRAAREHPADVSVAGRLLSALNYAGDATPEETFAAHERWGRLAAAGGVEHVAFANAKNPDKKLRVGFLSTDLWEHSVAYFLRPLLEARLRDRWEAVCYSTSSKSDWMTAHLRRASDGWVDVSRLDERAMVDRIRADGLDVLIELSGHTAHGPLAALRRKAAPVQATYLGYPNTTGLPTIDWRIVDEVTDPAGAERYHTERLARLDGCFLCYGPPEDAPKPRVSDWHSAWGAGGQSAQAGPWPVTFGTFNSIRKIGPEVIAAWSQIIRAVPGSGMMLKTRGIGTPAAKRNIIAEFGKHGVPPDRVQAIEAVPDKSEHLSMYARIDIALDTFPYNGTTTTCEALWMGVPVVALQGRVHAGRVGASLLRGIGLSELVGGSEREFIDIAAKLAGNPTRLAELRSGMRERVKNSVLCDAAGMGVRFERVLRMMWRDWCQKP